MSSVVCELNPIQRHAVETRANNVLVLAGAGSGKTRVLVHRIAWLIENNVSPAHILAVTFTNKAANEMRQRVEQMLGVDLKKIWLGTFHGLAHRFLRLHWREADLPQTFQILDADDQLRLLRRIYKTLAVNEEQYPVKSTQALINDSKERCLRLSHLEHWDAPLIAVYRNYEDICTQSGLVDFAELLLRSYELFQKHAALLRRYHAQFAHILIDEFQDTNVLQYQLIRLLAGESASLMIVGDDDQSIYSWRGANVGNMKSFQRDFAPAQVIRLEQNYRSTAVILQAANAVIAHNADRLGKKLWANGATGDPIVVYNAFNEFTEARYIADQIHKWRDQGKALRDVAVFYRANAQSRVIEEQLMQRGIAYCIYGGLRFFDRAEIRDVLAYLRLTVNAADDVAFERIFNVPTRGLGEATLALVRNYATHHQVSLWIAAQALLEQEQLTARQKNALADFLRLLQGYRQAAVTMPLAQLIEHVIKSSGLDASLRLDQSEAGQLRVENLEELINATHQFASTLDPAEKDQQLKSFLDVAALEGGEDKSTTDDRVQLMTLHAAKGLEFPVVFICGMEEGLFPHAFALKRDVNIEEERRLCYVGMTRAMQQLYFTYAENRRWRGASVLRRPSRFVAELPRELFTCDTLLTAPEPVSFDHVVEPLANAGLKKGQKVKHEDFGVGTVLGVEGEGETLLVKVQFVYAGTKLLSPLYAPLELM